MLPLKNILSPTDFSETSYKAIKVANELAVYFSARLVVLHVTSMAPMLVTPLPIAPPDMRAYQNALEAEARKQLQEVVEKLISKELRNFTPKIVSGYYSDEILRVAREEKSDLIVMGTRGRTGLPHLLLGSVAERVVQLAPCAVLTIGPTAPV